MESESKKPGGYRADVDGLRAIAVLLVVLFHLGAPFVPGGFVGVDVFFVISGYLITLGINEECKRGTFSLVRFYERRIRRIFPALFAMLLICWCAAMVLLMPLDFLAFSKSLAAASLSVSNLLFWSEGGYFEGPSELKPLLHTWSLAVEEQFYVVFPLLLLVLRKWFVPQLRLSLISIATFSLIAGIACTHLAEGFAFYWLPFRAWELLIGSILAVSNLKGVSHPITRNATGALGLLIILGAALLFSANTPFPGLAALAPTVGTALIIFSGATGPSAVKKGLTWQPLVAIGLISYSVYLWHWPLIVFTRYQLTSEPSGMYAATVVAGSLLAGWASWRWVEKPFRFKAAQRQTRGVLITASAAACLFATLGAAGVAAQGWPDRVAPAARHYAAMRDKCLYSAIYDRGGCFLDNAQNVADYDVSTCATFATSSGKLKVLLFGDSFAAHLFPGLTAASDIEVRQFTATSCSPMTGVNPRCDSLYQRFFSRVLEQSQAEVVIVSSNWRPYFERHGSQQAILRLQDTLSAIQKTGKRIVLVGQSPTFYQPVPHLLATQLALQTQASVILTADDSSELNAALEALAQSMTIEFLDPYRLTCKDSECVGATDGLPYHWDTGHLTQIGSVVYAQAVVKALRRPRSQ